MTIAGAAPGVSGLISLVEARLQGRTGPRVLQPYYDIAKLFRKEALAPDGSSWVFLAAPLAAMACYLTVPLLIPVLTTFGLPLGYMGDILGGGFILSLASFVVAVAALDTGSPYAQMGASRAKTFGAITEPVILFVVFTVALVTGTDLPYALAATVRSSASQIVRPAHLLAAAALFMVILYETGRIPVETHTGTNEFGMIGEARPFEHSGPYFALRSATAGVSGQDSYTAFGFANPNRRALAAVLHTRAQVTRFDASEAGAEPAAGLEAAQSAVAHVGYSSDVMEVVEEYLYRPFRLPFALLVRLAQRMQSGRLDAYLAYMLIALIAVLAVVTGLH